MSLVQNTSVYQSPKETADRRHTEYGFVLALVCMALALVVGSVIFTPAPVGSGNSSEIPFMGP
jgi:predicted N-acetyltransferase YhbS